VAEDRRTYFCQVGDDLAYELRVLKPPSERKGNNNSSHFLLWLSVINDQVCAIEATSVSGSPQVLSISRSNFDISVGKVSPPLTLGPKSGKGLMAPTRSQ